MTVVTTREEAPVHATVGPVARARPGVAPIWPVTADSHARWLARGLTGRRAECRVLDRLVEAVRAPDSQVLVVHGEPGVGKTALLEYLAGRATGCRVLRVTGVQSEMELAFAGLHQLCAPLLGRLGVLPGPQRQALATAFGMSAGPAPDRLLVGLAILGLLSDAAVESPVLCVVDDAHWLDRASAQVLVLVARRLRAEPVGVVFGTRVAGGELAGLPELAVEGLPEREARALLDVVLAGPVDARVRDEIVAETRGNPLALLELPRGLTPAKLAGGFGWPGALPLTGRIEDGFRRRVDALPDPARRLLLVAAADPTGDLALVWRAAGRLGVGAEAAGPAAGSELAEFGARVRFRHPLVRSAVYRSAPARERRQVHHALAEATDPQADPDRRAWHRAQAANGPDEEVAAELERSAGRARARGGLAATAAFLERAAELTPDRKRQTGRMLAAAQAHLQAGAFGTALKLLAAAEAGPLDELQAAGVDWLRGQAAFASSLGSEAAPLLLKAARRLEPLDLDLARETYLDAWQAALMAGHLANGNLEDVSGAARSLPPPARSAQPTDLLLDGLTLLVTAGPTAAAPVLRQALSALADADIAVAGILRWSGMAKAVDEVLWADRSWRLSAKLVQFARDAGALSQLPILLGVQALDAVWHGEFTVAASLIAQIDAVGEATGVRLVPYVALRLAALRGREQEAAELVQVILEQAAADGRGRVHWAAATMYNGLGHYADALAAAREASEQAPAHAAMRVLPELIEAAARSGNTELAREALGRLAEWTQASGTDMGLGIEARCRALVSDREQADRLYQEAITRLGRTRMRPDLARARLLYGEWLRRHRRPSDAREQLRSACRLLDAIGMEAFAERARRELRAAGGIAGKHAVAARAGVELTAQEVQIARLAADGLSNPEIGTRLFLSPRTVQYHLGKVFTKLDITSRAQLGRALSRS